LFQQALERQKESPQMDHTPTSDHNSPAASGTGDEQEDIDSLSSVKSLRLEINANTHQELKTILKKSVFVGWINATHSLLQYNDKLIMVNMNAISEALIFQLVIEKFGRFKKIGLKRPLDIAVLIKEAAVGDLSPWASMYSVLIERKDMLAEYFSIVISEDGKLTHLPHILENYVPPLHRIPDFLLALMKDVNWDGEKECFETIAKALSEFYRLCEEYELEESISDASSSQQVDTTVSCTKERLQWITEHCIFPAMRLIFKPPNELVANEHITELASIPDLFKVFERC